MLLPVLLLLFYFSAIQHTHTPTHKITCSSWPITLISQQITVFLYSMPQEFPMIKRPALLLCSAVRHQCAGEDFSFLVWLVFPQGSWLVLGWCKSTVVLHGWDLLLILEYILKQMWLCYTSFSCTYFTLFFANDLLLAVYFIFFFRLGNDVRQKIQVIFLFEFKIVHKVVETT